MLRSGYLFFFLITWIKNIEINQLVNKKENISNGDK